MSVSDWKESETYRNYEELYKYILSNDSTGTGFEK